MMNLDTYTTEMSKSIWDKAFFMDKIPGTKCIIDFGCADGAMIHYLAPLFPNITFMGYDCNKALITLAREKNSFPNVVFWHRSEYWQMIMYIRDHWGKDSDYITINFSSVLHEVFSKIEEESLEVVQILIQELKPKYITVRDMYYSGDNKYVKFSQVNEILARMHIEQKCINEFENKHESILCERGLLHFLMKYQWKDNGWLDELEENYFSWDITDLMQIIGSYNKIFEATYMLPYYADKWKDFRLDPMDFKTHIQLILRRNN